MKRTGNRQAGPRSVPSLQGDLRSLCYRLPLVLYTQDPDKDWTFNLILERAHPTPPHPETSETAASASVRV